MEFKKKKKTIRHTKNRIEPRKIAFPPYVLLCTRLIYLQRRQPYRSFIDSSTDESFLLHRVCCPRFLFIPPPTTRRGRLVGGKKKWSAVCRRLTDHHRRVW